MDLHEQRQAEVARQVAKVKARTRPWRAIIALVLAVAVGITATAAGRGFEWWTGHGHVGNKIVTAAAAAAFCLFAFVAILALAGRARKALQPVAGSAHAAVVRYAIVLVGAILTLVITLALFKVPVDQLVVGGALTTILIGIAAQQSLSNIFAGIVLLLSRPFNVGDAVLLRSGALAGQIEGTVTEIGLTYLRLDTVDGLMSLPNSQVLAAAVSRRPPATSASPYPGAPEPANRQHPPPPTAPAAPASHPGKHAAAKRQETPAQAGVPPRSEDRHQPPSWGSGGSGPRTSTASPGEPPSGGEQG